MTALARYERLEAAGRYFDGETARPREVIVKFGDASLIVSNMEDLPITHWSLAGVRDISHDGGGLALTPDRDSDERLIVTDPEMVEAIREVCPDLRRRPPPPRNRWRRIAIWSALALGSVYAIAFHIVPSLADQMAALIPPEAEIAMGEEMVDQFAALIAEDGPPRFCESPAGTRALAAMTARLETRAGSHVPLTVRVLDHSMVNAFALPGGQIVLFRGLLEKADDPEEVAGVLGHEIGHVVARDPTRLTLRSAGTAGLLGILLGDFTGTTVTVGLTEAILRSGYQREAEAQADVFAADLLGEEGLPTAPLANFFDKLHAAHGETSGLLTHLSTHPDLRGRAAKTRDADAIGNAPFEPVLNDQDWVALRNICEE